MWRSEVKGSSCVQSGRTEESISNLLCCLRAHVQDLRISGQGSACLLEQALHGAGIAGSDAELTAGGDGLQAWIAVSRHFAEIGDGLEAAIRVAELLQDVVLDAGGDDLGVGAAAVEDGGRCAQ